MNFSLLISALLAAGPCEFPKAQPEQAGLQPAQVRALIAKARHAGSEGFVILKDGQYIGGFGENEVRLLYSVTKPITGMAVGRLFTEGKWTDVDAPLASLLPEFARDPKGAVTLRQMMSHTSGIREPKLPAWNQAADWLTAALRLPLESKPGAVYKYNNVPPQLTAIAVERAAGERMDRFVFRTLFQPLCIENFRWITDRAGYAAGYTGLFLSAYDLAKLGHLVVSRGEWNGERLLSEEWIRQSALEPPGLLWFVKPDVTYHSGDGGQYLVVFPNHGIVVARVRNGADKMEFNLPRLAAQHLLNQHQ